MGANCVHKANVDLPIHQMPFIYFFLEKPTNEAEGGKRFEFPIKITNVI